MKKLLMGLCAVVACTVIAQEVAPAVRAAKPQVQEASWPIWLAFNSTKHVDVTGIRFTLPYGRCESVTGFDIGFWGSCRYFEGLQVNILHNEAEDVMAGVQFGIFNTAGRADLTGAQLGLFNDARSIRGFQLGIVNVADMVQGCQIGIINRAETAYGFQVGGVNVIRESELAFFPIVNIGFDMFPIY